MNTSKQRMTLRTLSDLLRNLLEIGYPPDMELAVAADPEGNEFWPLRISYSEGRLIPQGMRFDMEHLDSHDASASIVLWPGY